MLFPANGSYVTPEILAIDYIRLVDGRFFTGDGTQNRDWFGYGAPIRAVAAGRVVSLRDGMPEVPPFITLADNPTVTRPSEFGGNGVVVKIRPGVFALYAHMQPDSVQVEVGQRVRTGQTLGLLGNSGNTAGPHLHFTINEGQGTLTYAGLPHEIDRYRLAGTAAPGAAPGELVVTGEPQRERGSYPLATSVSDYSR